MLRNKLLSATTLLFVCICSLLSVVNAQTPTYNSVHIQQLTERDGLPSNSIYALMLDDLGRVWIGCPNGLSVYDGYGFRKFLSNPNDSTVISGTIAYAMLKDDDGAVWVGTNPAYIERYDPITGHFTHQGFEPMVMRSDSSLSFLGFTTSDIVKDGQGNIYAGVSAFASILSGLMVRVKGEDNFTLVNPPVGDSIGNVFHMRTDRKGQVWVMSQYGVYRIDERRQLHNEDALFKGLSWRSGEAVNDFLFDADNQLWLLTNLGGLVTFNVATQTFTRYQYAASQPGAIDFGNCMALHPNGNLWLGTSGGIKVFSPKTKSFSAFDYSSHPHLAKALVTTIIFDKHGEAFIGTSNNGLLRYAEKPGFKSLFTDPESPNGLPPGWVDRMVQAQDGTIWVHPQNNMVALDPTNYAVKHKFDRPTFNRTVAAFWQLAPYSWVRTLSDGAIFAATDPSAPGQKIQLEGLPATLHVRNRITDRHGNEWLVTLQGLYRKKPGAESYRHYDLTKATGAWRTSNTISVIVESRRHNCLWIGGDIGLYRYHYEGDSISRHLYDAKKGPVLVQQDVNSLLEDEEGILWIGQWQGGLSRYNPASGEVKHYNTNDGLPDMAVQSIAQDKYGMLWLSTFNGLSRFNPKAEVFNNFTLDDGLQSSQFADGSVLNTNSGDILFGGSNGITIVHPEDFTGNYYSPEVYITDVRVFGKALNELPHLQLQQPIYATKTIELRHRENNLALDFVAIHYSNPVRNRYAVIMENYDNEWRQLGNQRRAFYPNLPPGKYVFRVKASNDRGVWNETGASLEIIILPPWWRTWWAYLLYAILLGIAGLFIHRSFRAYAIRKEREKAQLRELEQKREIEKAYRDLGQAHNALQAAQNQLVQSEKMAALGELTAGIAHEIQNPLNFVNNFSEINDELISELVDELDSGNTDEAKSIADAIKTNAQKIYEHGRRADAIVKGMLQHSRSGSGQKESTDINALCDEYLRLAFHGLRAKDKSFNADIETDFDESIGAVDVVAQDMGRVILNLINNAFYAVHEKAKMAGDDYEPLVKITTQREDSFVKIMVCDNGNGIPDEAKEKIFQPFFTTKPTGSGTGLGLSLSYDIVKAHGGSIILNAENKPFTCFTISLPI